MKNTQEIREDFVSISNEIAQLQLGKKESFELALVILKEYGRYNRESEATNSRTNDNNENPITEKQMNFLRDLGVTEFPKTSSEASKKISELRSNSKGRQATAPSFK
ncbi:MAG: hypothetical protein Q8N56_02035 [bacterium]|nr:hypothetical protein [bacterium]